MNKENKSTNQYIVYSIILVLGIWIGVFLSQNKKINTQNVGGANNNTSKI